MKTSRVSVTPKAAQLIEKIRKLHGDLIFHQSGGCCDGTSPMCLKKSDFFVGSKDLLIDEICDVPFYMSPDQFTYFKNTHITIDVTEGRGSSFSLEIPFGLRFMTVSRLFTEAEENNLEEIKV